MKNPNKRDVYMSVSQKTDPKEISVCESTSFSPNIE